MPSTTYSDDMVFTRRKMLSHIDAALARLRLQEALRAGVLSLSVVLWVLVPMVLVDRILSLSQLGINIWIIWGGLACLSIPYILWRSFSDRINEQLAAVLTDERLGLHARLCTSLALPHDDHSAFGELFYREAAARLRNLDVAKAFPYELPRLARLLPIPALLAAGLWWGLPPQDRMGWVAAAQEKRQAEDAKKKTVKPLLDLKMQDLKREQTDASVEDSATYKNVNDLLKRAKDTAKQLQEGKINSEQALQALAELKRDIGKEREEHAFEKGDNRLKGLKDEKLNLEDSALTRDISEALKENDPGKAAQMMRQLARKVRDEILNNPNKTPEQKQAELKKLQDELERLAGALAEQQAMRDQLQELSEKTMDAAEFQQLQQQLKEQNQQNQQNQQKQPGKQQQGNQQGNQQQGSQQGQSNEQKAQDMAEQLEEAMQEVADGFDELEEESTQPDETDEAMDQLEEEVDNALDGLCPGGDQQGQQAGQKQGGQKQGGKRAGQKQGGRRSGRTGQKMGQGQQGQGQEGQQGQGQGQGQQGNNPAGQPGVGMNGGKGTGQRPYADGDAEFEKEKVRGKMQAGAITALSHFRGQGAKGEAPKEYINMVNRADQEAASSLELDHVPADARQMVKEYFSTLKREAGAPAPGPSTPPPAGGGKADEGQVLRE